MTLLQASSGIDWITILATVLGGFISGIVGITTGNYREWRNEQAEIVNWHEQVIQRISYTNKVSESGPDEPVVGDLVDAPGTMAEAVNNLQSDLESLRRDAPVSVDPEHLQLVNEARSLCNELTGAPDDRIQTFRKENNSIQTLLRESQKEIKDIRTSVYGYVIRHFDKISTWISQYRPIFR